MSCLPHESSLVALVNVGLDVPHLNHPFEYEVPSDLADRVAVGSRVQVPFGARLLSGWVVGFVGPDQAATSAGRLRQIKKVAGPFPLLDPGILRTAQYLAARYATNLKQVLTFAFPQRRARVELQILDEVQAAIAAGAPDCCDSSMGRRAVADARNMSPVTRPIRAVATLLPGQMLGAIASAVGSRGRGGVVVVVPTTALVGRVSEHLRSEGLEVATVSVEDGDTHKYRTYLRALAGIADVVVGTRAAVWTPLPNGGSIVIWDDGDDRLRERQAPRMDALDVAVARCHVEGLSLLTLGYARSVKDQALVNSGWAADTSPARDRALLPRVRVFDWIDAEAEGSTGRMRLPNAVFKSIGDALEGGPVLVQVAAAGYETEVHSDDGETWTRVGADKIAEEIAEHFPDVPVVASSSSSGVVDKIDDARRIVVATTGAEPVAPGGYSGVILAQAEATAYLDTLDGQMEAARRFMGAMALGRPGCEVLIVGTLPQALEQSLTKWRPEILAQQELASRTQLAFPPAAWVVAAEGPPPSVDALRRATSQLAGVAQRGLFDTGEPGRQRLVVSCGPDATNTLMRHVRAVQERLSEGGAPLLRIECNPVRIV